MIKEANMTVTITKPHPESTQHQPQKLYSLFDFERKYGYQCQVL